MAKRIRYLLRILRKLFFFEFSHAIKTEIINSVFYCFKFNLIILSIAVFLVFFIDKNSSPNWLFILKEQGLVYFFPGLFLPSQIIYTTLTLMPVVILFVIFIYFWLVSIFYSEKKIDLIKYTCFRYILTFMLLFYSRKIMLLFIGLTSDAL